MDMQKIEHGRSIIAAILGADQSDTQEFDFRLRATVKDALLHIRTDVSTTRCGYLFLWSREITRQDEVRAALIAALHPNSRCECHNLKTGAKRIVSLDADKKSKVLTRLVDTMRKVGKRHKKIGRQRLQ